MNKFAFPSLARAAALSVAVSAAIFLSACQAGGPTIPAEAPLAGARIGAPLALTNQEGAKTKEADFVGRYRLVYFGYTYCPDVCPIDLQHLMNGFHQFAKANPAKAAKVQPIFITIDPERDTPDKVKAFIRQFDDKMVGLTGSAEEIAVVAKGYAVVYNKVKGGTPDSYLMAHTQLAYLMDPAGKPIAFIPTDDISTPVNEGDPAKVKAELDKWVQ